MSVEFLPVLSAGAHHHPSEGACFMEYCSVLAGEKFSDRPGCVDPTIGGVARNLNDSLYERGYLVPYIVPAMGTGGLTKAQQKDMEKVLVVETANVFLEHYCNSAKWISMAEINEFRDAVALFAAGAQRSEERQNALGILGDVIYALRRGYGESALQYMGQYMANRPGSYDSDPRAARDERAAKFLGFLIATWYKHAPVQVTTPEITEVNIERVRAVALPA